MGRLIDEEELKEYIIYDGCDEGCGYIDERDLKYVSTVEAIPKDQYEARLKADLAAMLTELQLEIEEEKQDTKHLHYNDLENAESYNNGIDNCIDTIQQKINSLKSESEEYVNFADDLILIMNEAESEDKE